MMNTSCAKVPTKHSSDLRPFYKKKVPGYLTVLVRCNMMHAPMCSTVCYLYSKYKQPSIL